VRLGCDWPEIIWELGKEERKRVVGVVDVLEVAFPDQEDPVGLLPARASTFEVVQGTTAGGRPTSVVKEELASHIET
jgi:hypothetical protein